MPPSLRTAAAPALAYVVPVTPFNAAQFLVDRHVSEGRGERAALVVEGRTTTYADLAARVRRAAAGLRALGVRPEERVFLVMTDDEAMVTTLLAALRIGAVPLPVNPLLPGRDLAPIAADSRARVAVVSGEKAAVCDGLVAGAPELTDLVVTGDGDLPAVSARPVARHRYADVLEADRPDGDESVYPTWEDSPGFWLCTSGTTGQPKLAMHRQVDLRTPAAGYAREVLGISPDDRYYTVAPVFHAYGLGNAVTFPFFDGGCSILDPVRPPTPARVAETVQRERPTLFFAVPTFYAALLAADLPADTFASVRHAVSAGEALPAELFERFKARFGVEILDGIGSTELVHVVISNRPGSARGGTSGSPVSGYEVRLLDADGQPVPQGEPGELVVKGDTAATGYWCRTEATRRTFRGEWTHTGDMYVQDPDGCYSYLGRFDDMFKVGGEWVSPLEVESVLLRDTAVQEVAVVAGTTRDGVLEPVAYVVAAEGRELDVDGLGALARAELAGFKRPRRVVTLDAMPKTATGKIRRTELRRWAAGEQPS